MLMMIFPVARGRHCQYSMLQNNVNNVTVCVTVGTFSVGL